MKFKISYKSFIFCVVEHWFYVVVNIFFLGKLTKQVPTIEFNICGM